MSIEISKKCNNCGKTFKQHVSFREKNGRIIIQVYRYKCPFCDVIIKKPTEEEIKQRLDVAKKGLKRELI